MADKVNIKKDIIDHVINEYYSTVLKMLLASVRIAFDKDLQDNLQNVSGVYRIIERNDDIGQTIYVGQSSDLKKRLYSNLFTGKAGNHTLIKKLINKGRFANEQDVKIYLESKCLFQVHIIEQERERKLFEHFAISIFRPIYND